MRALPFACRSLRCFTKRRTAISAGAASHPRAHPFPYLLTSCACACPCSLEKRVLIPLPEPITRDALWRRTLTKGGARLAADISYETLVARTDGYSCADIVLLAKDALVAPLRELAAVLRGKGLPITEMPKYIQEHGPDALPAVSMAHLEDALRRIKSSVGGTGSETMRKMAAWAAEYGST